MYLDYTKLSNNNIIVYSVNTDAFTIKQEDLQRAKQLINFNNNIGGWRCSKIENIKIPRKEFESKHNNFIPVVEHSVSALKLIMNGILLIFVLKLIIING